MTALALRCLLVLFSIALLAFPAQAQLTPATELFAQGLQTPVAMTFAPDQSGRLFILSQNGRIFIRSGTTQLPTPFLDISALVTCCGEQGLLGLAFHPSYASNGFLYVYYSETSGNQLFNVVARYSVSASNPNLADPGSAQIVLRMADPYSNHNGGQLKFGRDGYLYIATGDGGAGGDPQNRAQNLNDLLGKILRIDVDSTSPYAIPPTNPFVGRTGVRGEIWAYGLRNPWRFTFDRLTGDMFIGDVGQGQWEEIDFQPAGSSGGENYGWRVMEGAHCYNATSCNQANLTLPILEYDHGLGCSVTGGYRYRGTVSPRLRGMYLYGDYCSGRIWGARPDANGVWTARLLLDTTLNIVSFAEDAGGEVYVIQQSGSIHRLVDNGPALSRGDANGDELVTASDIFYLINFLFAQGEPPIGPGDVNGSGIVDTSDIFYLINHLFAAGPPPV